MSQVSAECKNLFSIKNHPAVCTNRLLGGFSLINN
nr:MAG TPA: hypothetical protein [Caudoviricetes sp.]